MKSIELPKNRARELNCKINGICHSLALLTDQSDHTLLRAYWTCTFSSTQPVLSWL